MNIVHTPAIVAPGIALQTLHLVKNNPAPTSASVVPAVPTNHILVIDCSGSMDHQLSLIRAQLKNKLPHLVKADDTVSIIWFSGRFQCSTLAERVKISSPVDLQHLNKAIDQWLKPVALTGFLEPLHEVRRIAAAVAGAYSLFFLTDGCDNQWPRSDIVRAAADLHDVLAKATFVEYGWCCDHDLIANMTAVAGGTHIFCEDFEAYDPVVSSSLTGTIHSAKKVEVAVDSPLHEVVFSVGPDGPCVYKVENGKVRVPEDVEAVHYFTSFNKQDFTWMKRLVVIPFEPKTQIESATQSSPIQPQMQLLDNVTDPQLLAPIYQGAALLAQRLKAEDATNLLAGLGDVKLFRLYANAFGKQNLADFQTAAIAASNGKMFEEGRRTDLKVNPDAFCLLRLLSILSGDPENFFVPSAMNYKRISRATEEVSDELTSEEQAEIVELTVKAKTAPELEAVKQRIAAIVAGKPKKLTFKPDEAAGYPIVNLTWNEDRANVSLLVKRIGTVELPPDAPAVLPHQFPTCTWRNYAIIRDGIANIDELPVRLSQATFQTLKAAEVVFGDWEKERIYMLNLRTLPTINRSMVGAVSAKELFTQEYELLKLKAAEKVLKAFDEKWRGKRTSESFKKTYGDEAADWLTKQGITDYSGFNPKRKLAPSTDFYKGLEVEASISGLKTIPTFKEAEKKLANVYIPLGPRETLFKQTYDQCLAFEKANPGEAERKQWIEAATHEATNKTKQLMRQLAQIKFGILVGKAWPDDLKSSSPDEGTITLMLDGLARECRLAVKEVEIAV